LVFKAILWTYAKHFQKNATMDVCIPSAVVASLSYTMQTALTC